MRYPFLCCMYSGKKVKLYNECRKCEKDTGSETRAEHHGKSFSVQRKKEFRKEGKLVLTITHDMDFPGKNEKVFCRPTVAMIRVKSGWMTRWKRISIWS